MRKMASQNDSLVLKIEDLSIGFQTDGSWKDVVEHIDFDLIKGETLAIVGESGSGKSVTSFSILGLLPKGSSRNSSGKIIFDSKDLTKLTDSEFRSIRGNKIAMIFQEPMTSLNPVMKCGAQVTEVLLEHHKLDKKEAKNKVIQLFKDVKLPRPEEIFSSYPHEISGGQKQRVVIAMALICDPQIIIADEPTTALDVTVQKEILSLLKDLQTRHNLSLIFISHDLEVVKNIADHILVMKNGKLVESGTKDQIFNHPKETYTLGLINCKPPIDKRPKRLPTIGDFEKGQSKVKFELESPAVRKERHALMYSKEPILEVNNLTKTFFKKNTLFQPKKEPVHAVKDVSFKIYPGETLGLVGESGCGKTTLSRCLLNLMPITSGSITFQNSEIQNLSEKETRHFRKDLQIIFQDPYSSLNPKKTIGSAIMEPMEVHNLYKNKEERKKKALELLDKTGLLKEHFDRYPHEFSGGQRQRIVIARTLALSPKLIICDESVSALDVSVQAQVLNLLNDLKEEFGFTYLFISHDLSVVKYMSDRIIVMNQGKIEEIQEADFLFHSPKKEYTRILIDSMY